MREIVVPSKWVLAGEHSVLRGKRAVMFPNFERQLKVAAKTEGGELHVVPADLKPLIASLSEKLKDLAQAESLSLPPLPSELKFTSNIPTGAGLGSSAALSVAFVKCVFGDSLPLEQLRKLSRKIEDHFHGESSGMDIVAVTSGGPTCFQREQAARAIALKGRFQFELHDTGLRASTRECISQVLSHPDLMRLDEEMGRAAEEAIEGLEIGSAGLIVQSMERSTQVYREWGLIPKEIERQMADLRSEGATAVRLTGAGRGGFLVSFSGRVE